MTDKIQIAPFEITKAVYKHCGRGIFTAPADPKLGWLHYREEKGRLRSDGRACRKTQAEPLPESEQPEEPQSGQSPMEALVSRWERRAYRFRVRHEEIYGTSWEKDSLIRRAEEVELCAKEIREVLAEEPEYEYVFRLKASGWVGDARFDSLEKAEEFRGKALTANRWTIARRRKAGPWEDVS